MPRQRWTRWGWRAASLGAGALLGLVFSEAGLWWWAYVGLAPVLVMVAGSPGIREALWRTWFAAFGFVVVVHHWLAGALGFFLVVVVAASATAWLPFGAVAYCSLRRVGRWRSLAACMGRRRRVLHEVGRDPSKLVRLAVRDLVGVQRGNPVDFLQVLWPDEEGHYPGEPEFNDQIEDRQPLMWMPVAEHPPSVWTGPHTRAIIPAARSGALAGAVQAWETRSPGPAAQAAALDQLAVTLGSLLGWAYSRDRVSFTLLPADVQYVAAKAFVAWNDRLEGDADDAALGDQLHRACRLLMDLGPASG